MLKTDILSTTALQGSDNVVREDSCHPRASCGGIKYHNLVKKFT